jgi:parallel beta-helix repeat protein
MLLSRERSTAGASSRERIEERSMTNTRLPARRGPNTRVASLAAFALATGFTTLASATEFHVDPAAGTDGGDGSAASPWKTLEAVVSGGKIGGTVKAGDTVWLRSGHHGAFAVTGGTYATPITIKAASGATPTLTRAAFTRTAGWVLDGVSISPSHATPPAARGDMVRIDGASSKIAVRNCEIFSVPDASNWTADQWINAASSGVQVGGADVTVSRNRLRNVRFGISVGGDRALVERNEIVNFSADGLRGLGDDGVFEYNVVKNAYVGDSDGDDNHDDGFQSWSVGADGAVGTGVVRGVVLRGNLFLNREDPNQKLTNSLQAIGCFDGFFEDWVVENNVVITDHWHGISLYGARNSRIVNNTVIDVNATSPGPPWIMVTDHKDTTPSENVIVRNNLATAYDVKGNGIVQDHNTTLKTADLARYFVDPARFDLHLLPDGPAVNAGIAESAPSIDRDGIPRPQGTAFDLGAYEWHDGSVTPPGDAGTGTGGGASESGGAGAGGAGAGGSATASGGSAGSAGNPAGSGGQQAPSGGAGGGSSGGATPSGGPDGGPAGGSSDSSGCGCELGGNRTASLAPTAAFLALLASRRRKRHARALSSS